MKKNLTKQELLSVSSMLFGLFFGAGNLIFPISMGQMAGKHLWLAAAGFLITGVGLPLLVVAALGLSRKDGLLELGCNVGRRYGVFFTVLCYLTIGPFFAIPRCATVSYTVGMEQYVNGNHETLFLGIFSLLFFLCVLYFSLKPGEILTWIGKILNPLFLLLLALLLIRCMFSPMGKITEVIPIGGYASQPFFQGFLEGYNTMDAIAGLAFGIIVVNVIRSLGVKSAGDVAKNTVKAGMFSSALMGIIYVCVAMAGATSRVILPLAENGGIGFLQIAHHYYGKTGGLILAGMVTVACLKTAIGLITSCGETFVKLFPNGPSYRTWAILFCVGSFLIANLGLNAIIIYSLPVLMFLYPLAITLSLLAIFGKWFGNAKGVYQWTTAFTLVAAGLDFVTALPEALKEAVSILKMLKNVRGYLPMAEYGFGWVIPALLGLSVGCISTRIRKPGNKSR